MIDFIFYNPDHHVCNLVYRTAGLNDDPLELSNVMKWNIRPWRTYRTYHNMTLGVL